MGGLLQLWVEMLYLKRVLGPHLGKAEDQCIETLRLIAQRVLDALKIVNPQDLEDVQRFTVGVQVCHDSHVCDWISQLLLELLHWSVHKNLPFCI